MAIPTYPTNFIPEPFASDGQFTVVPETKPVAGRASYANGFPIETQRPLAEGGIAPNRLDFNGMFNILSRLFHWQQSGGQWNWSATLNYQVPNIVYHNGVLWWCVQANGVETTVVTPGTNEAYWVELLDALVEMGGTSIGANPVGTIIDYWGTTAPEGYFACDGTPFSATNYPMLFAVLGSANKPDLRGYFIRGYDTRVDVDPDAPNRGIGSIQTDTIVNITGMFGADDRDVSYLAGAFYEVRSEASTGKLNDQRGRVIGFDASRVVPTSSEVRPKNICLLKCIKHD